MTGKDRSRARRCCLLFRPEVGVCPAAFCAGSSRLPSCAATAAEGQEQGPSEEAAGGTREREGGRTSRRRLVAVARPSWLSPGGGEAKTR